MSLVNVSRIPPFETMLGKFGNVFIVSLEIDVSSLKNVSSISFPTEIVSIGTYE
jgi:hypothetical protein